MFVTYNYVTTPATYPLDQLTPITKASLRGVYSLATLFSNTGPVVQISNTSAATVTANFYGSTSGVSLSTGAFGSGLSLTQWLAANPGTAYVTTWYDQSGSGNHGTTSSSGQRPVINVSSVPWSVDMSTSGTYFNLPNGTIPQNTSYTFHTKLGYYPTVITGCIFNAGTNSGGQTNSLRFGVLNSVVGYDNYWYYNDYYYTTGTTSSNLIEGNSTTLVAYANTVSAPGPLTTATFTGGTSSTYYYQIGYINGTYATANPVSLRTGWAGVAGNEFIGNDTLGGYLRTRMYHGLISNAAVCAQDKWVIEQQESVTSSPWATGGIVTSYVANSVTYYVHSFFASVTTFTCSSNLTADVLVVAGGGGGGGGGGGAGGVQLFQNQKLSAGSYPVVVGLGGTAGASGANNNGANGQNSQFGTLNPSIGGGGGGSNNSIIPPVPGGSGGGAGYPGNAIAGLGIPGQGYPGGTSAGASAYGGGGGAGGPGGNGTTSAGGAGGPGILVNITGTPSYYGGGGGGAVYNATSGALGGPGGGGSAGSVASPGFNGQNGLGGGGGGVFSGQAIQTAQLEVGYGVMSGAPGVQFTTKPTYTPGASAVFSITFDIFVTSAAAPTWRNIFAHNAQNNNAGNRAPSFYLTGTDTAPSNRAHFNFNPGGGGGASVSNMIIPQNQWYNITLTSDGSNAKVYMNGTEDTTARFSGTFTWPNPDDQWYWCNALTTAGGSILVRNFYFYNNITLSAAQIASTTYAGGAGGSGIVIVRYAAPTALDEYQASTILLLHADSLVDSSPYQNQMVQGSTVVTSATKQFGTGSFSCNGSSNSISTSLQAFGSSDFTIELWANPTASNAGSLVSSSIGGWSISLVLGVVNVFCQSANGTGAFLNGTTKLTNGTWTNVVFQRSGSTFNTYINGNLDATAIFGGAWDSGGTSNVSLGVNFQGYLDEIRVSLVARYPLGFQVPGTAFQSDSSTILLIHADLPVDASPLGAQLTTNAFPTVTSNAYIGAGALGFNGTAGQYYVTPLSNAYTLGTGNFTIEFWINQNGSTGCVIGSNGLPRDLTTNAWGIITNNSNPNRQ